MVVLDPPAQAAGDRGQHGVVDGRAGESAWRRRGARRSGALGEGHLAGGADLPVERRAPRVRAPPRAARTRPGARAGGVLGMRPARSAGARRAPSSQSTASAKRIATVPSASAWWMRQTSAARPPGAPPRRCATAAATGRAARRTGARPPGPQRAVVAGVGARVDHVGVDVEALVLDPDRSPRADPAEPSLAERAPPRAAGQPTRAARPAPGAGAPSSTTLQVCPATDAVSSVEDRAVLVGERDAVHRGNCAGLDCVA